MKQTAQSSKVTILILISRFLLVLIYFYLGIKHLVNPESFRATIALPETGSNIWLSEHRMELGQQLFYVCLC